MSRSPNITQIRQERANVSNGVAAVEAVRSVYDDDRMIESAVATCPGENRESSASSALPSPSRSGRSSATPGTAVSPCPAWKRAMDVAGTLVGFVVLSPLLMFVAVWINCVSRGPVFFRQQRYGLGGRPFVVWKFRTMQSDGAEEQHRSHVKDLMSSDRTLVKCDGKMRIIRGGRVIRQLGLDELPQLINVLAGEMSLVGPRPDVMPLDQYQEWHRCRFDVLPGITGLWQVSGKNQTTFSTMMKMDTAYVERRSLWLDLAILVKTIPAVISD
jgi:lipopolysaccharide/colanic/teichoic acid biosynthesis glycosyltransferase